MSYPVRSGVLRTQLISDGPLKIIVASPLSPLNWEITTGITANTDYRFPRDPTTGLPIPLRTVEYALREFGIRVDQPATIRILESEDGITFEPIDGFELAPADVKLDRWNRFLTNRTINYAQIQVVTGSTPPSFIRTLFRGRI